MPMHACMHYLCECKSDTCDGEWIIPSGMCIKHEATPEYDQSTPIVAGDLTMNRSLVSLLYN